MQFVINENLTEKPNEYQFEMAQTEIERTHSTNAPFATGPCTFKKLLISLKLLSLKPLCICSADMDGPIQYMWLKINAEVWESPVHIHTISSKGSVPGKLHF